MDPALETIKTSFLLNFRTGNVLSDTMINGLIIMAVGYVTTSMGAISRNFTLTKMREGFLWVLGYRKRSIFISGMITRTAEDNRPVFSTRFKAVLHKIKKLELAKAKITGLKEIKIASEQDLFVEQFRSFYFTPEVEGNILCFDDEKNGGKTGGSYTELGSQSLQLGLGLIVVEAGLAVHVQDFERAVSLQPRRDVGVQ